MYPLTGHKRSIPLKVNAQKELTRDQDQDGHNSGCEAREDPSIANSLNSEVIPARGRWDNRDLATCIYLLRSRVHSPDRRQVRLLHNSTTVPAVWLKGPKLPKPELNDDGLKWRPV